MKIFVGYASKQGQSRKIAQWSADRFADAGHTVELLSMSDATDLNLSRFDRAVFVASIHAGHYNSSLIDFVSDHSNVRDDQPSLLLSISLAAAGHDAEDWRGLNSIVDDLKEATGWAPSEVSHVAGAYVPSKYDLFTKFIMRRIIAQKDPDADLSADHEYTDWSALGGVLDAWVNA